MLKVIISFIFERVALYIVSGAGFPISRSFNPAITMIRQHWGRNLNFPESVVDSWLQDRWARDVVPIIWANGDKPQLFQHFDFARYGWEANAPLPLCQCSSVSGASAWEPKCWSLVKTNRNGPVNTVTLKCSRCETLQSLTKPQHVNAPSIRCGEYYHTIVVANTS